VTLDEVRELHYIAHRENLGSILQRGILSYAAAAKIAHTSVAMPEIQQRRSKVNVPNGRPLHHYANLYFNCRNKMMSKIRSQRRDLCVLRVDPAVLLIPGTVISDQNASSDYVRFLSSPDGLRHIDRDYIFARSWKHPLDQIEEWRHGSAMCAEVLVPDRVESKHIMGCYVSCQSLFDECAEQHPDLDVRQNGGLFF